jgi:DNA ligase D-like protein (predicted 3'-phosphoesterase)
VRAGWKDKNDTNTDGVSAREEGVVATKTTMRGRETRKKEKERKPAEGTDEEADRRGEAEGTATKKKNTSGQGRTMRGFLAFVIHKHKATSLHYDFRLQVGDVMPSWSIPKGPSLDSSVRRLAIPTSDHELGYRRFEGVIGDGYGAGPVMIWDEGTYTPEVEVSKGVRRQVTSMQEAQQVARESLAKGNLKFFLHGKKLEGSFALVRTEGFGGGGVGGRVKGKAPWLLIKHRDEYSRAGYDANDYDVSASSGRSMQQIAGQQELDGAGKEDGTAPHG